MIRQRKRSLGFQGPVNREKVKYMGWRRKWQPTQVFLPGKSHGQRSLVNCSPWGCKRVGQDLMTKQQQNIWEKQVEDKGY